jgi:mxaK protein
MNRRKVHLAFAAAATAAAALLSVNAWLLHRVDQASRLAAQANPDAPVRSEPEAEFARAAALSAAGRYEAAAQAYKALTSSDRPDMRSAAQYNLANLHLREALKNGPDEAVRSLPLIELAKQGYRTLLRADPDDWDARYNLERALWLAPEIDESSVDTGRVSGPRERAISTLQGARRDLP